MFAHLKPAFATPAAVLLLVDMSVVHDAKAFGSPEQSSRGDEGREGGGESEDGQQQREGEEREKDGGEDDRGEKEQDEAPPAVDWMGRAKHREFPTPGVLSPFAAARRERIIMLPGWVRAFKPWGDFLQVMRRQHNYFEPQAINLNCEGGICSPVFLLVGGENLNKRPGNCFAARIIEIAFLERTGIEKWQISGAESGCSREGPGYAAGATFLSYWFLCVLYQILQSLF